MSKGYLLGTLSANGSLGLDVEGFYAPLWSLFIDGGTYGGGAIAFEGGDGSSYTPIMITNPANAGTHSALIASTQLGLHTFNAICARLRFTLSGSTSPNLTLTLFPQLRP